VIVELRQSCDPMVRDVETLTALSAIADGTLDKVVLAPICKFADDTHVWVSIDALRASAVPPANDEDFDRMIAYAQSKGWVDPVGGFVRAHVEVVNVE